VSYASAVCFLFAVLLAMAGNFARGDPKQAALTLGTALIFACLAIATRD